MSARRRRPAPGCSRRTSAPTTAATRHAIPIAAKPQPVPPACTIGGSASDAAKPLIGIAVCLIPSASPRCEPGNHAITARPLADCTLAPRNPASTSRRSSASNVAVCDAPSSAKPQPPTPASSTHRSPTRSVASPHGISETTEPASDAEMRTPICAERDVEVVAQRRRHHGDPNQIAEYVACANVPAARTAQRVQSNGSKLRDPDLLGEEPAELGGVVADVRAAESRPAE